MKMKKKKKKKERETRKEGREIRSLSIVVVFRSEMLLELKCWCTG